MATRTVRTRRTAARTTKATTATPAKRTTRTAANKPAPAEKGVLYANGAKTTRYDGFDHAQTSAYSIGGLEAIGLVKMTGKGKSVPTSTSKEKDKKVLTGLFGPSMVRHWIKNDWIATGVEGFKITVNGLNRISDRINNPSDKYGVSPEQIQEMEAAINTGKGKVGSWSPIKV